jgi:hypothetical protein
MDPYIPPEALMLLDIEREAKMLTEAYCIERNLPIVRRFTHAELEPYFAKVRQAAAQLREPPYPWCHGSPTREACAERGYCNRNPNCGE